MISKKPKPTGHQGRVVSIYLYHDLAERLASYLDEPSGRGGMGVVLQHMADQYLEIISRNMPEFSENEWSAILDANNGGGALWLYGPGDQVSIGVTGLWANVADSPEMDEKWNISTQTLATRLRDLPYAAQVAAMDVVTKFWCSPDLNNISTPDLLRRCGAKITPQVAP